MEKVSFGAAKIIQNNLFTMQEIFLVQKVLILLKAKKSKLMMLLH